MRPRHAPDQAAELRHDRHDDGHAEDRVEHPPLGRILQHAGFGQEVRSMAMDSRERDRASARAGLRRAAAEAAARGTRLRLDAQTAMLILRATGAADLDPEVLIGLLVTSLEQAELAPVLEASWRERGEAALNPKPS
jgi:hypothetical protein